MTMQSDVADDVLGVARTLPRPGWIVLDAIRERRFTGEVVFATTPEVRVYADRGRIYLAERPSDSSLGARLVDAGALNAAQLEHGSMRVGAAEHLGRLFERVPSVDRHQVLVITEMMTDECIGWLAGQRVSDVTVTPYRHHPAGVHRWDRAIDTPDLAPGAPLPAPAPDEAPVALGAPEPLFRPADDLGEVEDMIRWNEPSWLDERLTPIDVAGRLAALRAADEDEQPQPLTIGVPVADAAPVASAREPAAPAGDEPAPAGTVDWIDNLSSGGLPEPGSDPLASPVRLAPLPPEPIDRFELIWPSGDVDEEFGGQVTEPYPHPDIDRAGVTARLAGRGTMTQAPPAPEPEQVGPDRIDQVAHDDDIESWLSDDAGREAITDEVVLAVRRAVASIETGSLAARRRLAEAPVLERSMEMQMSVATPTLPGRVAVRSEGSDVLIASGSSVVTGSSVFDNLPPIDPHLPPDGPSLPPPSDDDGSGGEIPRASALRRLIGSIRRR